MLHVDGPEFTADDHTCPITFSDLTDGATSNACVRYPCMHIFENEKAIFPAFKNRCPSCNDPWVSGCFVCTLPYTGFPKMAEANMERETYLVGLAATAQDKATIQTYLRMVFYHSMYYASEMPQLAVLRLVARLRATLPAPKVPISDFYFVAGNDLILPATDSLHQSLQLCAELEEMTKAIIPKDTHDTFTFKWRTHFVDAMAIMSKQQPMKQGALAVAVFFRDFCGLQVANAVAPKNPYILNAVDEVLMAF